MNGIERPLSMAQKFIRNSLSNSCFISLLVVGLIATCALIADIARAQEATSSEAVATSSVTTETALIDIPSSTPQMERAATRQTIRTERKVVLTERHQERIINLAANISNRLEATVARLEQIAIRLESRITKTTDSGVDTTEATASLLAAQTSIAAANTSLATIDSDVTTAITSESPATAWNTVQESYLSAAAQIQTAHQALLTAVRALQIPPASVPRNTTDEPVTLSE
jgi:TolA-binding protein